MGDGGQAQYLPRMDLLGRVADERLLDEEAANLPTTVGRPEPLPPPGQARRRLVGLGATLTGLTLIAGIALVLGGIAEAVSNAIALGIVAIAVGMVLVGTHWGWVHVAEWSADSIERRRTSAARERRSKWLHTVEPYARYEVATSVDEDGSIRISRFRYRPQARGEHVFTFLREVEHEEVHPADEPGAAMAERAELLRHEAAADTRLERERFEAARAAYESVLMSREDAAAQRAARRAESEALSERINTNLGEPPSEE